MKADRDPVLRHESDEFIPQRVDDCVPWIYESALMIQEIPKPQPIKLSQLLATWNKIGNYARSAWTVSVVVSAKFWLELSVEFVRAEISRVGLHKQSPWTYASEIVHHYSHRFFLLLSEMRCVLNFIQERLLIYDFVGTPSGHSVGEVVTSCGHHWS